MSAINSTGSVAHGVGGGAASINNVAFSSAGAVLGWIDDETVAFANGADAWTAARYHVPSAAPARLSPFAGANFGFAGGGHAAWWWAGGGHGLYATTGLRLPAAALLGMGPDAAIGYKPNYNALGPTRVRDLNGTDWQLSANHAYDLRLLGGHRALWKDSATLTLRSYGIPQPATYPGQVYFAYAFQIGSAWWIGYYHPTHGTLAHPFTTPSLSYVLVPPGVDNWPSFRAIGNNRFRFAWAAHEGEQPGEMTFQTVTVGGVTPGPLPPPDWPLPTPPSPGDVVSSGPRAKVTTVQKLRRQYPHVEGISDWRAQQTSRLLWDRVFDLEERLLANVETVGGLVDISNSQDDSLGTIAGAAGEALALAQRGPAGGGGVGGDPGDSGGGGGPGPGPGPGGGGGTVAWEGKHQAILNAFASRYPPNGSDEDWLRDHWIVPLCEQFAFSFPGEGWGHKRASSGRPPSSDVVARKTSSAFVGYDVILGAGTSSWHVANMPGAVNISSQVFIAVSPTNHL